MVLVAYEHLEAAELEVVAVLEPLPYVFFFTSKNGDKRI
jgi:hypothetical protein